MSPGPFSDFASIWRGVAAVGRTIANELRQHWALGLFSLGSAFIVWIVIQDVENPRVEGEAPQGSGIAVQAVNVPDGCIVDTINQANVNVRVDAREDDFDDLRAEDFEARVDVSDMRCDGNSSALLPVTVESNRDNVDVLEPLPDEVRVTLVPSMEREVPVTILVTAPPPAGFMLEEEGTLPPADP